MQNRIDRQLLGTTQKRFMLAFLLLLNPHIGGFDILPDFIGAFFLWRSVRPLRYVAHYFDRARHYFLLYFFVSCARVPASALILFLTARYPAQTTLYPLFSLSFGIIDMLCLLPAILNYVRAYTFFAERRGPFAYAEKLPSLTKLMTVFFLLRTLLGFLPDLVFLSDDAAGTSYTGFYPLLVLLSFLPCLISAYMLYMRMKETVTLLSCEEVARAAFAEREPHEARALRERKIFLLSFAWLSLALSALFYIDFHSHGMDLLSDILTPVCLLVSLYLFGKFLTLRDGDRRTLIGKKPMMLCLASLVLSLAADLAYGLFFGTYDLRDVYYDQTAEALCAVVVSVVAVKAILDVLTLLSIRPLLRSMALEEAGAYVEESAIHRVRDKNKRELSRIVTVFTFSGIALAVTETLTVLCNLFPIRYDASDKYVAGGETVLPALDFLRLVFFVVALLRFCYMLWGWGRLSDEVKHKYDTDE